MTTEEFLEKYLDQISLHIKDEEVELIKAKHRGLREALVEELALVDHFLTGSYRRGTIIKPLKLSEKFDVDVFIVFSSEKYAESDLKELRGLTIAALNKIKEEKKDLGITEIIEEQRKSVGVSFGSDFQIDIVPSIEVEPKEKYKIFDRRTGKAVVSNPKKHGKRLREASEQTESGGVQRLRSVVRMLKAWKRDKFPDLKSFHLELLVVEILGDTELESYSQALHIFFQEAESYLQEPCINDPGNSTQSIDSYLDEDDLRDDLLQVVRQDKEAADEAWNYSQQDDDVEAIKAWKKVLFNSSPKTAERIAVVGKLSRPWLGGI